jgi:hypothetical protein
MIGQTISEQWMNNFILLKIEGKEGQNGNLEDCEI